MITLRWVYVLALIGVCVPAPASESRVVPHVTQTATTTTISASPNPATMGSSVTITATVMGAGATGTIIFSDGTTQLGTGTLGKNATASTSISSLVPGTHGLTATYSGDATHLRSTSPVFTETVNKFSTTTTLAVSPSPANTGQIVTLTATVTCSAGATGDVMFYDGSPLGTSSLVNGTAVFPISLAAGTHTLMAIYGGDAADTNSASSPVSLTVTQAAATTTVLKLSSNPAAFGQSVILTATVTPSTAAGTVTFKDGTASLGSGTLSNGTASFTTSTLTGGTHSLVANYGGDSNNGASASSAVVLTVNQVTLAVSPNPSPINQSVTLTATVIPSSTGGTVSFRDGSSQIGTGNLSSGTASFTTSVLAAGSHTLTATFSGSTSNSVTEVVNKASSTTTLLAFPTSSAFGQTVSFTANVSPSSATGTVTFLDGQTTLATAALNNGTAPFTTANLTTGTHSLTAVYSGDTGFSGSTSAAVAVAVGTTPTTTILSASPNPANSGQAVILTAAVTPASATGTVTFKDGNTTIGTATLTNGSGSSSVSTLTVGNHNLTASYSGDSSKGPSTSATFSESIVQGTTNPTTTILSASPNPANSGQAVILTAAVTPASATGTVTFKDGNTTIGTATLINGSSSYSVSTLTVGNHSLTASYSGDSSNSSSTSATYSESIVQVGANPTTTILSASPNPANSGQAVILTAAVTPVSATGTVTFKDGNTTIGTATLINGSSSYSVSTLTVGNHSLTASYSGDSSNSSSTSLAVAEIINQASNGVTLAASPNPAAFGKTVTLTATVSPASATGTVTISDSVTGSVIGTAPLNNGTASVTTATLKVGSHSLQALYGGDSNNAPSLSNLVTEVINSAGAATTVTLSVSSATSTPGQAVVLTVVVTPSSATGTVTFKDGSATLGTATLSGGTATTSISTLVSGSHTLTASYSGDANYNAGTSNSVTETVSGTACVAFPAGFVPFTSFSSISKPDNAGDLAVVGSMSATNFATYQNLPLPAGSNQQFCGTVLLAQGVAVTAYVPTAAERTGDFSPFAGLLTDPASGQPFPGGIIPTARLPGTMAWRISAALQTSTTSLSITPLASTSGQPVTLTATVSPSTATGTVDFLEGSQTVGTATLAHGTATSTISTLAAGTHSITASYRGDASDAPSTSVAITETVSAGTPLKVLSPTALSGAFVGTPYSQAFTATGGTTPYTWSLVSGSQELTMTTAGNNGLLSGAPKTAGTFTLTIRVQDAAGQATSTVLSWTVNPAMPPVSITSSAVATISDQPVPTVSLGQAYPAALNATFQLSFTPNAAGVPANFSNSAVQFVTGGIKSPAVAIPANSTSSMALPAIQLGSVAGTITLQLSSLTIAGTGQSVLPTPAPSQTITVPRLAPIIVPGSVKIANITSSGFQVILNASSTPRDLNSASVVFTAASGTQLSGTQTFTVSLAGVAGLWFDAANANAMANGGAFSLTLPFAYSGDTSALGSVSITLTNSVGASTAVSGGN